jgi:hypothetical protein
MFFTSAGSSYFANLAQHYKEVLRGYQSGKRKTSAKQAESQRTRVSCSQALDVENQEARRSHLWYMVCFGCHPRLTI